MSPMVPWPHMPRISDVVEEDDAGGAGGVDGLAEQRADDGVEPRGSLTMAERKSSMVGAKAISGVRESGRRRDRDRRR